MPEYMQKPAAGRVAVYEWLRLIATLFVVVGHSAYWVVHTTYGGIYYNWALEWAAPVYFSAVFDAARRMATISAWAVGSLVCSRRLWPRAMMLPFRVITQPMGSSPSASANRASCRASRISSRSLICPPSFLRL